MLAHVQAKCIAGPFHFPLRIWLTL